MTVLENRDPAGSEPQPLICPEPVRRPVMVQRWNDVVFLHWRFEPDVVQRLLPTGVQVDTFDGSAWVGLIPFHMDGLGISGLGTLPHVGSFPEVNVRTYARAAGRVRPTPRRRRSPFVPLRRFTTATHLPAS